MSGDARALLTACGLYCGACYHYRASQPDDKHLMSEAARRGTDPLGLRTPIRA
jgi:hypothetical protein